MGKKIKYVIAALLLSLSLTLWPLTSFAESEKEASEGQIKKRFIDDCLKTSKDKYELYRSCIGKFTNACLNDPEKFAGVREQFSTGILHECTEVESKWWQEVYIENADELTENTKHYLKETRILDALASSLSTLQKIENQCDYPFARHGYRDSPGETGELPYPIGFEDYFSCIATVMGEKAITVYLWNRAFKAGRGL